MIGRITLIIKLKNKMSFYFVFKTLLWKVTNFNADGFLQENINAFSVDKYFHKTLSQEKLQRINILNVYFV